MAGNSTRTAKRRGPGKPFAPGMSGNPSGRPRVIGELRDLARQHTRKAIQTLVKVMEAGELDSARVAAANGLLDRAYGRPSSDCPVVLRGMTGTLSEQGQVVLKAMAAGQLLPGQASQLLQAIAAQCRIVEIEDLAGRIEALEEAVRRRSSQ